MITFTGNGISVFGFVIYYYGLLIMGGVLVAAYIAAVQAERHGRRSEYVWDMLTWLLIAGIIGARLWHVFTPPPSMVEQGITTGYYLTHPLEILNMRRGGLGIPGAVIGGAIALWIYTRRRGLDFAEWADYAAPGLAVAQAIGRWGNYFNQEVYGAPTSLPWAITIEAQHRLPQYQNQATYHPLFFYEFLWNLINAGILLTVSKKFGDRLKRGDIFLLYLIIYPVGRFVLEFLRVDASELAGMNANQTLMGIIAIAALASLILRHRSPVQGPSTAQ